MSIGTVRTWSPDSPLRLVTLGGAALMDPAPGDESAPLLGPGKPLALLAYLTFSPGRAASREHLVDLLWSDVDPKAGNHTFRQTVWYLKQRLGEDALCTRDSNLVLTAPIETDRDDFLAAIEQGQLDRAVKLYAGDFLPGFAAPGGADFEHWADIERYRLRLMLVRAAETLVRLWLSVGHARDALRLARRVRDLDPADERGWRLVLESLASANDPIASTVEADALEQLLRAEEREPEPATRALLDLVRQAPPTADAAGGSRPLVAELVGREKEFAAIIAAWDAARRGPGRHVHITAPAGLGKTRLLGDVHARLRASGARVVTVRANVGERHISYVLAADLAERLCRLPGAAGVSPAAAGVMVALNPSLSARFAASPDTATGGDVLRRRTVALCEAAAAVADEAPLAILVDDVHWADEPSRQVLQGMVDRVTECRTLIVTTARPMHEGRVGTPDTEALALDPLTAPQVAALVASLGELPGAPWAAGLTDALHDATDGSPLLVLETLQLLAEEGGLVLGESGWECPSPAALAAALGAGSALRHRIGQLDRAQGWLMLLLAAAGRPLPAHPLARAATRPLEEVQADLAAMEQRGLVTHGGTEWEPAHDEIAALGIELAPDDARRAAHGALGVAIAEYADEAASLARACQHLAAAAREAELRAVFGRAVRWARRGGDRRSLAQLADEALGPARTPEWQARLVASLPIHVRLGFTSPGRIAAAVGVGAVIIGAVALALLRTPPPLPDAILVALPHGERTVAAPTAVAIRREGWEALTRVEVRGRAVPAGVRRMLRDQYVPQPSPDGRSWIATQVFPDSGGKDLVLLNPNGSERRLTFAYGDDNEPAWSPDGRWVAYGTSRWNQNQWDDVAIQDLITGEVRQLTSGSATDGHIHWSPDGTRIAFDRLWNEDSAGGRTSRCWITPDGSRGKCPVETRGPMGLGILGWLDEETLLLAERPDNSADTYSLLRLPADSGQAQKLEIGLARQASVSPDGRWVTCLCLRPGQGEYAWVVFPAERPDLSRPVTLGSARGSEFELRWLPTGALPRYVARVRITERAGPLPLGVTHRLSVQGFDADGGPVPVPQLLAWRSNDTAVARVSETDGVVTPRRAGSVMIHVSVGGWRTDSLRLAFAPLSSRTLMSEPWTDSLGISWAPYGEPRPILTTGPHDVPALWSRGDDYFNSGVYSRRRFPAWGGLGLEVRVSSPVNAMQWQYWVILLNAALDSAALAAWDHRTGSPHGAFRPSSTCGAFYPAGVGPTWRDVVVATGSRVPVDRGIRSGDWWTLRLQIFPDGSCGVAVNGRPLHRRAEASSTEWSYQVLLQGKSVGTRMLVGPLEVWEGVRQDVDWSVLDRYERPLSGASNPRPEGRARQRQAPKP